MADRIGNSLDVISTFASSFIQGKASSGKKGSNLALDMGSTEHAGEITMESTIPADGAAGVSQTAPITIVLKRV